MFGIACLKRVKWPDLLLAIATFCVATFAFMEDAGVSIPLISRIKMPMLLIGAVCLLPRALKLLNVVFDFKYLGVFAIALGFTATMCVSMISNLYVTLGASPVHHTLRLILFLIELLAVMIIAAEEGKCGWLLKFLFRYLLVLTVVNDFFMITRLVTFYGGRHENYIVGTKFYVVYTHMALVTMWFVNRNRYRSTRKIPNVLIIAMLAVMVLVALRVDCMTGLIGFISLTCLLLMLNQDKHDFAKMLGKPRTLAVALAVCALFPFFVQFVLALPPVSFLIEDVLGRSLTLTGRLPIYESFLTDMGGYWAHGYGFGNSDAVSQVLYDTANTQNAVLHWIFQVGIPATSLLVVLILLIMKSYGKSSAENKSYCGPLVALVYAYIIMGLVEPTFNMSFFLWFGILFAVANEEKPDPRPSIKGFLALLYGFCAFRLMK